MDYFCFIEWEELQPDSEDSYMPKLSEEIPFLLLAGNPETSRWGLFECDLPEDYDFTNPFIEPVTEELDILLFSAKTFPPAIAMARDDFEIACQNITKLSKDQFNEMFSRILKQHLQLQKHRPFFLAEAQVEEEDFLVKGAFYWIIGFDPETEEVEWVSDDYYIYQNPASYFNLDNYKLRKNFLEDFN